MGRRDDFDSPTWYSENGITEKTVNMNSVLRAL